LHKKITEAPGATDLMKKLQDLYNPESLGDVDLHNEELTIEELKRKLVRSDATVLVDGYLDEQGCNCIVCGGLR
jgi:hypothetical protein